MGSSGWQDRQSNADPAEDDRPQRAEYEAVPQSEHGSETKPAGGSQGHPGSPDGSPQRREAQQWGYAALSATDSFILDVLRGWRLLVAASLTPDEWRDVLAATGNKLDYLSVSAALQTLWDDQLGGGSRWSNTGALQSFMSESSWPSDFWNESQLAWNDWSYPEPDHDSEWFQDAWAATTDPPADAPELNGDLDPALAEALEAEKAAESLALEARRTWSQAQQATNQLRRDRGFGKGGASSSSSVKCYNCSGPHLARDCPDRQHPSFRKGYGKSLSPAELDSYLAGKSKGKSSKGKSKDGMFSNWDDGSWSSWLPDLYAMFKGKGKNKGKGKPSANVYGLDLGTLELMETLPLELYSTHESHHLRRSVPLGYGMVDCGATASAGPEASVKKLIGFLRQHDPQLQVQINHEKRPFFRYGSGKWGQALHHAVISSSLSENKYFEVYVLENSPDFDKPWFTDDMLVPILIGMDHLSKIGLILDFSDGHAVNGKEPPHEPYTLEKNLKGHYMVNIAYYLLGSVVTKETHEQLVSELCSQLLPADLSGDWDEWYELSMINQENPPIEGNLTLDSSELTTRRNLFDMLVERRKSVENDSAVGAQVVNPSTVSSSVTHVQAITSSGPQQDSRARSSRPLIQQQVMALLRQTRELGARIQRIRGVEDLQGVCPENLVHPEGGLSGQALHQGPSSDHREGFPSAPRTVGAPGTPAQQGDGGGDDPDLRDGGPHCKPRGAVEGHAHSHEGVADQDGRNVVVSFSLSHREGGTQERAGGPEEIWTALSLEEKEKLRLLAKERVILVEDDDVALEDAKGPA